MVARMIVGVADQNVKNHSRKQLVQGLCYLGELLANDLGKVLIAGVARHHFIEAEEGQGGDHALAAPAFRRWGAIKTLD